MEGELGFRHLVLSEDSPLLFIDEAITKAIFDDDDVTAHRDLRLLAEQGDANAQVLLGTLFDDGWGTARDCDEAVKWYRRASEQGHPVAQYLLGGRYSSGKGVREDHKKMLELYHKAANQNYATAQYTLASMFYFVGPQNPVEAYKWAKLAAARLKVEGHQSLMVFIVESLKKDMTPKELAEAERLVSEWTPTKDFSFGVE